MHPLTAGNTSTLISADAPGVARQLIRESMLCPACYITGAAGDNHPKAPEGGFPETRRVGPGLATEATQRTYDAFKVQGPARLTTVTRSTSPPSLFTYPHPHPSLHVKHLAEVRPLQSWLVCSPLVFPNLGGAQGDSQLLLQFPAQHLLHRLTDLQFAARELPMACVDLAFRA